jgi:osomolarity two-component system phosphorelay intermediate protein YPD1
VCDEKEFIDMETFNQIREMDDDDDDDFSSAIVSGFMDQAEETFANMETAMYVFPLRYPGIQEPHGHGCWYSRRNSAKSNLAELSSLGHFLKGSSATLGLIKVKEQCEKIQHLGVQKDESGLQDLTDVGECLKRIQAALKDMQTEYKRADAYFHKLYPQLKND